MKRIFAGLVSLFIALATPSLANDLGDIIAAAGDDNAQAQIALGAMYEHGMSVALNDRLSAYWWQRAVDNGHTGIAKALGPKRKAAKRKTKRKAAKRKTKRKAAKRKTIRKAAKRKTKRRKK